jgi:CHAD domain-containing protein
MLFTVNKDLFIKHIRWLIGEYDKQLRLALKGAKEEPVHELRVMIKRLSALFLFLDEAGIYRKKSSAFFEQLYDFFKSAGNLRDIQVMRSLIVNYRNQVTKDITEYETYLIDKEMTAKDAFFTRSEEYPRQKQIQVIKEIIESVRKYSDEILSQKSFAFIIKRLDRIDKYLLSPNTAKYLHKIRQTLKQLRYFIEIFQSGSQFFFIEETDYNEIKEIENIIGGWNDRAILIEDITRYISYKQKLGSCTPDPALTKLLRIIRKNKKEMISDIRPRMLKFIYHLKYSIL